MEQERRESTLIEGGKELVLSGVHILHVKNVEDAGPGTTWTNKEVAEIWQDSMEAPFRATPDFHNVPYLRSVSHLRRSSVERSSIDCTTDGNRIIPKVDIDEVSHILQGRRGEELLSSLLPLGSRRRSFVASGPSAPAPRLSRLRLRDASLSSVFEAFELRLGLAVVLLLLSSQCSSAAVSALGPLRRLLVRVVLLADEHRRLLPEGREGGGAGVEKEGGGRFHVFPMR